MLDEFDVLFYDKRGNPSDFIYKLIVLEENLRQKGFLVSIISIANNVLSDYEIDDRVKSRIGTTEIFFEPYFGDDVLNILKERANDAFAKKIDDVVLQYCADLSSLEHGDARRAIDLLRVAANMASKKDGVITKDHIDKASEELQKDRVEKVLKSASAHFQLVCLSLAKLTFLSNENWHATSSLYKQYCGLFPEGKKPLTNRRVSELLTELVNTGLAMSQTMSKGRHGYGTQYRLAVSPDVVGKTCSADWWKKIVAEKESDDKLLEQMKMAADLPKSDTVNQLRKKLQEMIRNKRISSG